MHDGLVRIVDRLFRDRADLVVVVRFGDQYKQRNAAFDAGSCAALGKPYVTLHDADILHPLKEVDVAAQAWCTTTDQVVANLKYVLEAEPEGLFERVVSEVPCGCPSQAP